MLEQIFDYALWGIYGVAGIIFLALFFINAPYGRYLRKGWGPVIPSVVGWVLMETPAVVTIFVMYLLGYDGFLLVPLVFLLIWQSHYLYRTYIFPFRLRSKGKMMPLTVALMAIVFNVWNGFLNGAWLFVLSPQRDSSHLMSPAFIAGSLVFVIGMYINRNSDNILIHLRKGDERGYKIPYGGMFRFVSMPAYLGELLEWFGFALLTWSPAALSFAVFTAANLVPRAMANHRWYKEQFADYPKERKALIPFVL